MQLRISAEFRDVQAALDRMRKDVADRALASAVNKTLAIARTRMVKAITDVYAVKAGVVREGLVVKRASFRDGKLRMEGLLQSPSKRGRSRNLIQFSARETTRGVTVKVLKGGPRKLLPGAFIAKRGNRYGGTVFRREGSKRLPINALQTVNVAQMFNTKRVNEVVVRTIRERFPAVFTNEVRYFTDRFNQGGK